jgi:hypothetical protein
MFTEHLELMVYVYRIMLSDVTLLWSNPTGLTAAPGALVAACASWVAVLRNVAPAEAGPGVCGSANGLHSHASLACRSSDARDSTCMLGVCGLGPYCCGS